MNKIRHWLCFALIVTVAHGAMAQNPALRPTRGTKDEAVALVKEAVTYFKTNGYEKAFTEFNNHGGKFTDRDLYIMAYDDTGKCLAHGLFPKLIGTNRIDAQDSTGKYYIEERVRLMKVQQNFWTHYRFPDPLTHQIYPKTSYCEVVNDPALKNVSICAGIYDPNSDANHEGD